MEIRWVRDGTHMRQLTMLVYDGFWEDLRKMSPVEVNEEQGVIKLQLLQNSRYLAIKEERLKRRICYGCWDLIPL